MKKWVIGTPDRETVRRVASDGNLSLFSAEVLASRGIMGIADRNLFLGEYPEADELGLLDPFSLPDMKKAADIIEEFIQNGEKIIIYGDYDCDGIMASASLYNYLFQIGANVEYFINERKDGYGINTANVQMLIDNGAKLIITVDNGISAIAEAKMCREAGVKLVITDHHIPPEILPDADAVVDPHISSEDNTALFHDLCGCGVVLKLITALEGGESRNAVEEMSDFAAIATIGDIMPLVGENRTIIRHGQHYISKTENEGLAALLNEISATDRNGKRIPFVPSAENIAFRIAPRINASGRMASAMDACELFTAEDPERAKVLSENLCELNNSRKAVCDKIMLEIEEAFVNSPEIFYAPVIVVSGENWHKGVIGINAIRVLELTGKPVYVISEDGNGNCSGSARAPEGDYSVYESLKACGDLLLRFGGHKGAGGFSVKKENIALFRKKLCEYSMGKHYDNSIHAVRELMTEELNVQNAQTLERELSPFGEKNPKPVYFIRDLEITSVKGLSEGKYTKVFVRNGEKSFAFPLFNTPFAEFPFTVGEKINIMASLKINEFNGNKSAEPDICDMRKASVKEQKLLNGEKAYKMLKLGIFPPDKRISAAMLPNREQYAAVYTLLPNDGDTSEYYIINKLCDKINTCVLHVIFDAFEETGLISRRLAAGRIKKLPVQNNRKADFEKTNIIKSIREHI